jgi:hypothetical protein
LAFEFLKAVKLLVVVFGVVMPSPEGGGGMFVPKVATSYKTAVVSEPRRLEVACLTQCQHFAIS